MSRPGIPDRKPKMILTEIITYLLFFTTGLAISLHCIGMCGPILIGLSNVVLRDEITIEGTTQKKKFISPVKTSLHLLTYHIGRITTYTMLGIVAGSLGLAVRNNPKFGHTQHYAGLVLAGVAILFGLSMFFISWNKYACAVKAAPEDDDSPGKWYSPIRNFIISLTTTKSWQARLLLGGLMGFLPCGAVYAVLADAAALENPLKSALAMLCFGLGTIPALTAVVISTGLIPIGIRKHGEKIAAVIIILTGIFLAYRSWPRADTLPGTCPACAAKENSDESSSQN